MIRFYSRKSRLLSAALGLISAITARAVLAEGPQTDEASSSAKQAHARPQIIYHLANGSRETAEALHSQSKAADNLLDIGPNMPISLQLARANANAASQAPAVVPVEATAGHKVNNGANSGTKAERRLSRRIVGAGAGRGRMSQKHGSMSVPAQRGANGGGNGH